MLGHFVADGASSAPEDEDPMIHWFDSARCSHCNSVAVGHIVLVCSHADTGLNHSLAHFNVCLRHKCSDALRDEVLERFDVGFVDIEDFVWFHGSPGESEFRHVAWNHPDL